MHSALYIGQLRHRRHSPRKHEFNYSLYMSYLDLSELDDVFAGRWFWSHRKPALAWIKRADYLGDPGISIDQAVRDKVQSETGQRPLGPIRLLTHLRYFGIGFNPVSFYYCFDAAGERVEAIVAEITNTPWKERHAYVLCGAQQGSGQVQRYRMEKKFHVSPFMPMDMEYDWCFGRPGESLGVHMVNLQGGQKVFDATLTLKREEIGAASLARALINFPLITAKVVVAIYWQALRLWAKRIPFHSHPSGRSDPGRTKITEGVVP